MKTALEKFDTLCNNKTEFAITALCLTVFVNDTFGFDALFKEYRWYAQISDAILRGDVSDVTNDERIAFIEYHIKLMEEMTRAGVKVSYSDTDITIGKSVLSMDKIESINQTFKTETDGAD